MKFNKRLALLISLIITGIIVVSFMRNYKEIGKNNSQLSETVNELVEPTAELIPKREEREEIANKLSEIIFWLDNSVIEQENINPN